MRKFYRKDRAARQAVKARPCIATPFCRGKSDPCHVRSFGSSGNDKPWNMVPMCRMHHDEQHRIGWYQFTKKYPRAGEEFTELGWVFIEANGQHKLFNEKHENKGGNFYAGIDDTN